MLQPRTKIPLPLIFDLWPTDKKSQKHSQAHVDCKSECTPNWSQQQNKLQRRIAMPTVVNPPNFKLSPAPKGNDEEYDSDGVAFPALLGIESSDEDEDKDNNDSSPPIL